MNIAPCLFVGFGGTGYVALSKVKRQLHAVLAARRRADAKDEDGALPGCFQFLVFDLDPNKPPDLERDDPVIQEFVRINAPPISTICSRVKRRDPRYAYIAKWWPDLPPAFLRKFNTEKDLSEAFRCRLFGRAAMFLNAPRFVGDVRDKFSELSKPKWAQALRGQYQDVQLNGLPRVFVFSSIAGGTGCGMFLDGVALIRRALRHPRPMPVDDVSAFLFLPDVFADVPQMEGSDPDIPPANAYGALKELDRLYVDGPDTHPVEYATNISTNLGRPADFTYLVGSTNEAGQPVTGRVRLAARCADFAVHLLTGLAAPLGAGGGRAGTLNGSHEVSEGGESVSTHYSSFGLSTISYPKTGMLEWARHDLLQNILGSVLNEEPKGATGASGEAEPTPLEHATFVLDGDQTRGRKPFWSLECAMMPPLQPPGAGFLQQSSLHYREVARARVFSQIEKTYREALSAVKSWQDRMRPACQLSVDAQRQASMKTLDGELERLIADRTRGLPVALQFVKELDSRISDDRKSLSTKGEEAKKRQISSGGWEKIKTEGRSTAKLLWGWREPVIRSVLKQLQDDVRARVNAATCDLQSTACQALLDLVVEPKSRLLESLDHDLRTKIQEHKREKSRVREALQNSADEDILIGKEGSDFLALEKQLTEKARQKEPLVRTAVARSLKLDGAIESKDVESWLRELVWTDECILDRLEKGEALAKWFNANTLNASPLWSFGSVAAGAPAPPTFLVAAIREEDLNRRLGGQPIQATFYQSEAIDLNSLALVQVRDGAPVEDVASLLECFKAYAKIDRGRPEEERWPCTVLPGAESWPDLFPLSEVRHDFERLQGALRELEMMTLDGKRGGAVRVTVGTTVKKYGSVKKFTQALREDGALSSTLEEQIVRHFMNLGSEKTLGWLKDHTDVLPHALDRKLRSALGL